MTDNFTIKHYHDTLQSYINSGWVCGDVETQNETDNKRLVMIHDVDHRISACENFIAVEKYLNICATYFLRLHAKSYNMLSRNSISTAKTILASGGKIGLHYEPTFCPTNIEYATHINQEINILSNILDIEIKHFNLHEPARTGIDLSQVSPDKNRCYNSKFFQDYKYLSDSSCRWREGCFSQHIDRWKKLLVLTHPLWWYKECPAENY